MFNCTSRAVALIVATALAAILLAPASSARAGIVAVSRESSLAASGEITGDSFELTDSFTTLGFYQDIVSDALTPASGGTTRAEASQRSFFPVDDFGTIPGSNVFATAGGVTSAQVAELDAIAASASNLFLGIFDVTDEPLNVTIEGSIDATADAQVRVALTNDADASAVLFSSAIDFGAGTGDENPVAFNELLSLQPGRYRLSADATVNGTPTPNVAHFDVDLVVEAGGGNGGGGNVIPLPAASWPGALTLAAAGLAALRTRVPRDNSRRQCARA